MTNKININILDDYYDDGHIPENEIQETYAYVECNLDDEKSKKALKFLILKINELFNDSPPFEMQLHYYESAKKYPNLVGTEYEFTLYNRWQIEFKHLTHEVRENLVIALEKLNLKIDEIPFCIYSES